MNRIDLQASDNGLALHVKINGATVKGVMAVAIDAGQFGGGNYATVKVHYQGRKESFIKEFGIQGDLTSSAKRYRSCLTEVTVRFPVIDIRTVNPLPNATPALPKQSA